MINLRNPINLRNTTALVLLATASLSGQALAEAGGSELSTIETVVQKYFDGTSQGKPSLVKEAFHEGLELGFVQDGKIQSWAGTDYIAGIREGQANDRVSKIINVDVTGTTAAVKAEIRSQGRVFTDYLLLLKAESGWKIVNKTFSVATR